MSWSSGSNLKGTTLSPSNFNKRNCIYLICEMSGNKQVCPGIGETFKCLFSCNYNYSYRFPLAVKWQKSFRSKNLIKKEMLFLLSG